MKLLDKFFKRHVKPMDDETFRHFFMNPFTPDGKTVKLDAMQIRTEPMCDDAITVVEMKRGERT